MRKHNTGFSYKGRTIWERYGCYFTVRNGHAETLPQMYIETVKAKTADKRQRVKGEAE